MCSAARWWCVAAAALVLVAGRGAGVYVMNSILCDDIAAICEVEDLPYDVNNTACGDKEQFLAPNICNCGSMCIESMEEGDPCVTSSFNKYPDKLCGPGMACILQDESVPSSAVCTRDPQKRCINETLQYEAEHESGTLGPGRYLPNCDDYGMYAPTQCSAGSTCYCVNQEGKRLFGEGPISQKKQINCKCSVYWEEMKVKGLDLGMRCLPNGNFDPLQCIDDYCFCYDEETNSVPYGPLPSSMIQFIPCYDETIHTVEYTNPCHRAQEVWDSQGDNTTVIVAVTPRPICSPDGYYAAVQHNGSITYCADTHGNRIEDYELPLHEAAGMTCNCARRRVLMEETGLGASKPKCCPDGRYYPWQFRGLLAYCVDDNGNQYGKEVPATNTQSLTCHTTNPCESSR